jgi:sugar phosphate isomerase/epimerase
LKISISNIAWRAEEEAAVAEILRAKGVRALEVAPSMVARSPATASDDEIRRYRAFWNDRGVEIVAMQALLFGTEGLALFGPERGRRAMFDHLARIVRMGGLLGASSLVFGSPRNRLVGDLAPALVDAIALPFFRDLGAVAAHHGTCVCIEPNPPAYGADWIVNAKEALAFVDRLDHPGIGVHLDAGALQLCGEGAAEIRVAGARLRHFHASEPELLPLRAGGSVPHAVYAATLREIRYSGHVSVEMRADPTGASNQTRVAVALDQALHVYGSP